MWSIINFSELEKKKKEEHRVKIIFTVKLGLGYHSLAQKHPFKHMYNTEITTSLVQPTLTRAGTEGHARLPK